MTVIIKKLIFTLMLVCSITVLQITCRTGIRKASAITIETEDGSNTLSDPAAATENPDHQAVILSDDAPAVYTGEKADGLYVPVTAPGRVELTWYPVEGASGYQVYRSLYRNRKFHRIKTTKDTGFTDRKVNSGDEYYYKVRAVGKKGRRTRPGEFSDPVSAFVQSSHPRTVICGDSLAVRLRDNHGSITTKYTAFAAKVGTTTSAIESHRYFRYGKKKYNASGFIKAYRADRVFLVLGMNEWSADPTPTVNGFKKIVSRLHRKNRRLQVVILALAPGGENSSTRVPDPATRNVFNQAVKQYADGTPYVYYCPATDVLADENGYLRADCDSGDGCHWNETGSKAVLRSMRSWSRKNLGNW